jgi:hypothetical protein
MDVHCVYVNAIHGVGDESVEQGEFAITLSPG